MVDRIEAICSDFPEYKKFEPDVPVWCVTPPGRHFLHRFYDTSPISPSGRYIALTELPFDNRLPAVSDEARVVVIDLQSGSEAFSETTAAWDTQVGAHVQWGAEDNSLFYNTLDERGNVRGKVVDIAEAKSRTLDSSVYVVSPDGKLVFTPSIDKIALVQAGYGVAVDSVNDRRNVGASPTDGLFRIDVASGAVSLLVSFAEIYERLRHRFGDLDINAGGLYGFHVKVSPDQKYLMFIVRWVASHLVAKRTQNYLVCMTMDASQMWMPVDNTRWSGGHHPNWCPDSASIIMNLKFPKVSKPIQRIAGFVEKVARKVGFPIRLNINPLRFARFSVDGTELFQVGGYATGSGHPTMSRDMDFVLTDAYVDEPVAFGDGSVPIRWVSTDGKVDRCLIRMMCNPVWAGPNREWRVDPHPAWSPCGNLVAINGYDGGTRKVYVANLSSLFASSGVERKM